MAVIRPKYTEYVIQMEDQCKRSSRSVLDTIGKKKQQPSSAAASGHDIAQETVIDLIQREADEKVSGLLR